MFFTILQGVGLEWIVQWTQCTMVKAACMITVNSLRCTRQDSEMELVSRFSFPFQSMQSFKWKNRGAISITNTTLWWPAVALQVFLDCSFHDLSPLMVLSLNCNSASIWSVAVVYSLVAPVENHEGPFATTVENPQPSHLDVIKRLVCIPNSSCFIDS